MEKAGTLQKKEGGGVYIVYHCEMKEKKIKKGGGGRISNDLEKKKELGL